MSSSRRRVDLYQHHENHNTSQALQSSLLQDIKTNTENINVNVGDVEINVQEVENLITITNGKLDTINTTLTGGGVVDISTLSTHALQGGGLPSVLSNDNLKISLKESVTIPVVNAGGFSTATLQGGGLPSILSSDNLKVSLKETIDLPITNTTLTNLNNCIDTNELQVDIVSSALPSGAATDNSILSMRVREDEATVNGQYLMGVSVVRQDTLASLVGTSGDNTQMSVDANGALYCINSATDALLTTIDADTNAIKTAVENLDNAIDGNYLNINQNIAGTDVDSNSGNKSSATQRVCIADDDIPIALVNTKLTAIETVLGEIKTDNGEFAEVVEDILDDLTFQVGGGYFGSGGKGIQILGVRQDTQADFADDGEYVALSIDSNGNLRIKLDDASKSVLDEIQTNGDNIQTLLTTIDEDTNAIKIAVESLDNAVDGNYLNINQNIAGTDVDSNSGLKSSATQRVVIATDDIPIALVNTKLDHLSDNLDTLETTANNMETLLSTIDEDTNDIKTAIQSLDNAVDGNYLNVNANINGTDVDSNSGLKSAQTQRVCIATDDIPIALVNTKLDHLSDNLDTLETTANNMETLLSTIDEDTNDIKTAIQSLDNAVDGNYLNVNQNIAGTDVDSNSGNKSAATQRVVIATDDVNLSAIKTQIDLLEENNTIKDVEWLDNETISDQSLSSVLDTEGYQNVFIYGENNGSVSANDLKIFGSNLSGGTYYSVGQLALVTSDSGRFLLREDTPLADMPTPRYLKVFNATGTTKTITKLRAVMSHKLRYV
jgi:hypothetical protein